MDLETQVEKRIFHIGLPKTGTTSLQGTFLPAFAEAHFGNNYADAYSGPFELLWDLEAFLFGRSKEPSRQLQDFIDRETWLISDETILFCDPYEWGSIISRLASLFIGSPVTIILDFRDPKVWLESMYKQAVKSRLTYSVDHYFYRSEDAMSRNILERNPLGRFDLNSFSFRSLHSQLSNDFQVKSRVYPGNLGLNSWHSAIGISNALVSCCRVRQDREIFNKSLDWSTIKSLERLNRIPFVGVRKKPRLPLHEQRGPTKVRAVLESLDNTVYAKLKSYYLFSRKELVANSPSGPWDLAEAENQLFIQELQIS